MFCMIYVFICIYLKLYFIYSAISRCHHVKTPASKKKTKLHKLHLLATVKSLFSKQYFLANN